MNKIKIQEEIIKLYEKILFRKPDELGLNFYTDKILSKKFLLHEVEDIILSSPEASLNKLKFSKSTLNFTSIFSEDDTEKMLKTFPDWYHTFKFGNLQTFSTRTSLNYQLWCSQGIPLDLTGKSVLDIGANDGFYSFLCEQRGAEKVLAIDYKYSPGVPKFERFKMIKKILNSNVEYKKMDVNKINCLQEKFDIVLFFGTYYHLFDPILAFQNLASITNELLLLSGHVLFTQEPLLYSYGTEDKNRFSLSVASSKWLDNVAISSGFKTFKTLDLMSMPITTQWPHMMFGDTNQKVGTFEFHK